MKKVAISFLLLLAMLCTLLPMTVFALANEPEGGGAATGGGNASVNLLTPEDIYVPGATIFLSAYASEEGITVNEDGTAAWIDTVSGEPVTLSGGIKNIVGTYSIDHVKDFDASLLTVANTSQKIHYAADGTTEVLRVTLKTYTDPSLDPNSSAYSNFLLDSDEGVKVVICRSTVTVEAKDELGQWSADPALATYEMGGWSKGENGGIGYMLPDFFYSNVSGMNSHAIQLDDAKLPSGEMTFELVSSIVGAVDTDDFKSTMSKNTAWEGDGEWSLSFRLGALTIVPRATSTKSNGVSAGIGKVVISYSQSHDYGMPTRIVNSATTMGGLTYGSTIAATKDQVGSEYQYDVFMSGTSIASFQTSASRPYFANDALSGDSFFAAQNLSQTVYAVRVYDFALTADQLAQNRFADLAKYYDFDLTEFSAMNESLRPAVYAQMNTLDFSKSRDEAQDILDTTIAGITYVPELNQYDELYVQNGLKILLTAYDHSEQVVALVGGAGTWMNKIASDDGTYAKFPIVGSTKSFAYTTSDGSIYEGDTAWRRIDGAGIGYEATLRQLQQGLNNYVDLGIENLPNSHTVEMIFDPYGAYLDGQESYRSDSGVAERWGYIVTVGNLGIYSKHQIPRDSELTIAPHDSFYIAYQQNGLWTANDKKTVGSGTAGMELNTLGVVNLSVYREEKIYGTSVSVDTGFGVFVGDRVVGHNISSFDALNTRGDSFKLMRETPGTLYAIRVYDRMLTDAERAQNHFADLCAYYKLDLTDFYNTAILPEVYRQEVYNAMLPLGFSMTQAQAQEALTTAIFASLVRFDGFSVRTEGTGDELAAIFTVNNARIDALIAIGYKVFYGGIIADADVDITDIVYDSKNEKVRVFFLFSNDDGTEVTPVFISESEESNRFGLSVFYDRYTSPDDYGKLYRFRSFVVLKSDEETQVAYLDASSSNVGSEVSHFKTLDYLTTLDAHSDNEKLISTMNKSFNIYDLYLDVNGGNDANSGKKGAPVKTLEKALELAIELINSLSMPEVRVHIAGGTYTLEDTLTLSADQITNEFYRLKLEKAAGAAAPTISGIFEMDSRDFMLYDPDKNIYIYSLPDSFKDADGKYPMFQNMYVDGRMATLAETEWFTTIHDEYTNKDGRFTVWVPAELLAGVVEKDEDGKYYLTGEHPDSMRWATRMQWYYYDLVIESVDIWSSNNVSQVPCLGWREGEGFVPPTIPKYLPTEGYVALQFYADHGSVFNKSHKSVGTLSGHDYETKLTGSMAFLDEPGEFYYDQTIGCFYYIPEEGKSITEYTFGASQLENLIYLDGVKNLSFDGITFTGTDTEYIPAYGFTGGQAGSQKRSINGSSFIHEGAIVGKNVKNITVRNCAFNELYYHGIDFIGVVNKVTIENNTFTYLGGGAIQLGKGGYSLTDNNSNIIIRNNYVHEVGIIFYNNCAMTITNVKNGKILYNSIIDCAYTGISVGWSWSQTKAPVGTYFNIFNCEIAYNYIENFMFMMYDGGSIYTLGGNAPVEYDDYLNEMHHNYSYCGSRSGHIYCPVTSTALYHDGGSSHWYTHNNVTWVDQETLGHYNYISIQAGEAGGSQAYNILAEDNYFINLYQKYLTLGYRRVRRDWNVIERNSHMLTLLTPDEFDDTYLSVGKTHEVSKDWANWDLFYKSGLSDTMNGIIAESGCDLDGGAYKGTPIEYPEDYWYRCLTESETWYHPDIDNPDYLDR